MLFLTTKYGPEEAGGSPFGLALDRSLLLLSFQTSKISALCSKYTGQSNKKKEECLGQIKKKECLKEIVKDIHVIFRLTSQCNLLKLRVNNWGKNI